MKRLTLIFVGFVFIYSSVTYAVEYDSGVVGKVILQTEVTSNGDPIAYLKTNKPKITVMTVDIAPGAKTGWHSHPVPVYAYVMSGQLTVELESGKKTEFKEGDAIVEVMNVQHNGFNTGNIPVKLVVFYTGGKEIPNVLKADKP